MAEKDNRRSGGDSLERHSSSRIATRQKDDYLNEPNLTNRRSVRSRTVSATIDENFGLPRSKKRKIEGHSSINNSAKKKGEKPSLETQGDGSTSTGNGSGDRNSGKKSKNKKNFWVISEQSNNSTASTSITSVKLNKNNNNFVLKSGRRKVTQTFDTPSNVNEKSKDEDGEKDLKESRNFHVKRVHSKGPKDKKREKTEQTKVVRNKPKRSCSREEKKSNLSKVLDTPATELPLPLLTEDSGNKTYALRNQVRLDSSGALIPLYPPSRAEIAIAQGRKPFVPRRSKIQATTAWKVTVESKSADKTDNQKLPEISVGPQFRVTLRRSTRSKHNTGSCASTSSRRSSRAGKVGAGSSWAMMSAGQGPSTAASQGPSTSEETVPPPATVATLGSGKSSRPFPVASRGALPDCEKPPPPYRFSPRCNNASRVSTQTTLFLALEPEEPPSPFTDFCFGQALGPRKAMSTRDSSAFCASQNLEKCTDPALDPVLHKRGNHTNTVKSKSCDRGKGNFEENLLSSKRRLETAEDLEMPELIRLYVQNLSFVKRNETETKQDKDARSSPTVNDGEGASSSIAQACELFTFGGRHSEDDEEEEEEAAAANKKRLGSSRVTFASNQKADDLAEINEDKGRSEENPIFRVNLKEREDSKRSELNRFQDGKKRNKETLRAADMTHKKLTDYKKICSNIYFGERRDKLRISQSWGKKREKAETLTEPSTSGESKGSPSRLPVSNSLFVDVTAGSASGATTVRESYELTSESDDNNDVGRLQALLESRGLPPHLFGALGPRVQHLLNRSMGVSSSSKAQQLLQGLQATGDENQQLQAVIEMCQMLIMGNEDTLTGFPVKEVVPALISLMTIDENYVIMNHACRALTYMMEALPRSSAVVVDAVPVFLEKLQEIQCMDVAEQSLTALETLSRRHSKSILQARGVAACLKYLDFFSTAAQRAALAVTANCCQNLHVLELNYVADSLPILAARLTRQSDKKCVESICLAFCRLVDSFQNDSSKLMEIASPELLTNLQQLLVETPPVISTSTFISVLRMLTIMCSACPDLALTLLKQYIADTLCYLLTGSAEKNSHFEVELVSRSPQELYEMTCLIGELMPKLPTDGIFAVECLLERPNNTLPDTVQWQWRDEQGHWHPYGSWDSRMIEAAHQNGEPEILLNSRYSTYTINFHAMTQISEDYVTSWPIRRRVNPAAILSGIQDVAPASNNYVVIVTEPNNGNSTPSNTNSGVIRNANEERELASSFVRSLFSTLYEVYSSSAGPAVRYKCLKALLRMVYFSSPELLKEVLKNQVVSSHIAGMLASHDLRIVVGALQMANVLMQKLSDVFTIRFMREGVTHQIKQLASTDAVAETPPSVPSAPVPSTSSSALSFSPGNSGINGSLIQNDEHNMSSEDSFYQSPSQLKLCDVLSRKRKSKRGSTSSNRAKNKHDETLPFAMMQDIISKATSLGTSGRSTPTGSSRSRFSGAGSKTSSFLASLNPARWGRSPNNSSSQGERQFQKDSGLTKSPSNSNLTAGNKEKIRCWIRETASKFIETYFSDEVMSQLPAADVLYKLTQLIGKMQCSDLQEEGLPALKELCDILKESDISPFEVNHSGLVQALLEFLTGESDGGREDRLRAFLHIFSDCPLDPNDSVDNINSHCLSLLVTKLNSCVSQLEQFPVKVHDLPVGAGGARGGTSALKFFNTHQLKCNLQRHPDCTNLKQWKGGSVKIDPLALVQAIERYLVVRGYGRIRVQDSGESDDDNSEDDDIDDTLAAVVISQGTSRHQLQFLIGDHVLPYNMTVYQAVRQFTNQSNQDQSETDTDTEMPLGHSSVWVQTHTIQYRPAPPNSGPTNVPSSRKHKGSINKSHGKSDHLWNDGTVPPFQSPLLPFLSNKLPDNVTIQDSSLQVLNLLRVLHALSRYWGTLYNVTSFSELLPLNCFINSKVSAKASRQLQDPLVIMTGNLPLWLQQIALACPFLLPFETRQLLFYATSFDRDRALQRLLDATPDLSSSDSAERVTPKLDRRKRTISREDILKQAELVIQDLASSRALLEVQYENEVGTGLGPTLEFYALVSRELQRADLDLWAGEKVEGPEGNLYVNSPQGLFPAPLSRSSKYTHTYLTKIKSKFRFLGKFMAKAVMDSRLLDLPFSLAFYRWLLGQEGSLQLPDLVYVAPQIHQTLAKLQRFLWWKACGKSSVSDCDEIGCSIEDLCLTFTVPGHPDLELRKGGKDILVTEENLEQYIKLVCHWLLVEGVSRQMDAFREGFETVFPLQQLHMFYPEELDAVFCGSGQQLGWDVKTLSECFRPDHGYTLDSKAMRFLFEVLSSYNATEQRLFLQFVTGSPRLPVGGFKSLSPPLTVVRKDVEGEASSDNYLPSVMTCVNYLKLPDYSSVEVMRQRLSLAAREGSHSFHLS